jgi:hypothetical protein
MGTSKSAIDDHPTTAESLGVHILRRSVNVTLLSQWLSGGSGYLYPMCKVNVKQGRVCEETEYYFFEGTNEAA